MSKPRGYKRGLVLFLFISIATFALLFIFGQKEEKKVLNRRIALVYKTPAPVPASVLQPLKRAFAALSSTTLVVLKSDQQEKLARFFRTTAPEYRTTASVKDMLRASSIDGALFIGKKKAVLFVARGEGVAPVLEQKDFREPGSTDRYLNAVAAYLSRPMPGPGILDCLSWINPWLLLMALAFWMLNLLTDSYLLRVLLRSVDDDMPFRQCIYAFLGNEFLTAVTPFQSGGQPLMVFLMHKNNVSAGKGILITFFKTAGQIYFFALMAPVALLIWPEFLKVSGLTAFYIYGVIFFGYFLTLTFLVFFKPQASKKITLKFFDFLSRFKFFRKKNLAAGLKKILKEIDVFSFFIRSILKHKRLIFLWLFLLTALSWVFKFLVAVAVIWGLGEMVNVAQALGGQTVTNFLSFFAPTPGGSGVFEFTTNAVFKKVMSRPELLFVFVVIWRSITYYLSVVLGALVVVKVLKIKKKTLDEEEMVIEEDLSRPPEQDYREV